jgi:hypothetical protein
MSRIQLAVLLCALASPTLLTGCGSADEALATVPVSGRITLNSIPLCGAQVVFIPLHGAGGALSAAGSTDQNGEYTLTAATYSGVVPGDYKVLIEHYTMSDGSPLQVDAAIGGLEQMKMLGQVKQSLPPMYASLEATTLTALVTEEQPAHCDFDLTSAP